MIQELLHDPWSLVVIIMIFLAIAILYYLGKKKEAAKLTLELIKVAEELVLGSGKGDEKLSVVYRVLYPSLPKIIKILWGPDDVYHFIDWVFESNKKHISEIILSNKEIE
ncbi:hypothetical protein EZV73_26545 [Acidaminobacter sp. JC074]|uniref:hypothetical protein n=1 Tax=Acidaminobacter sp. JC074 TaxID=2530199 RepID=UPI001F116963|nr:hypothetical protein [Acidaminobacter sp. JC074]MCH4891166.1 hypothetical protein [Acidaminobacter sp. JC074]